MLGTILLASVISCDGVRPQSVVRIDALPLFGSPWDFVGLIGA